MSSRQAGLSWKELFFLDEFAADRMALLSFRCFPGRIPQSAAIIPMFDGDTLAYNW